MRIDPIRPPPEIDFDEWDSMIQILFSRKNKTLSASLKIDSVIKTLQNNYEKDLQISGSGSVDIDVKFTIDQIIDELKLEQARASKMDITSFLR